MGGVAKEYITRLGCEIHFCSVTYLAPLEMLKDPTPSPQQCIRIFEFASGDYFKC
jgi:hypothetical protein